MLGFSRGLRCGPCLATGLALAVACGGDDFTAADESSSGGTSGTGGGSSAGGSSGTETGGSGNDPGSTGGESGNGGRSGTGGVAGSGAAETGGAGSGATGGGAVGGMAGAPLGGSGGVPPGGSGGANPSGGTGGVSPTGGSGGIDPSGGTGGISPTGGVGGIDPIGGAGGMAGTGGMGGAPPLFVEDFEDGDTVGWTLAFPHVYSFTLVPGTGADGSDRSLELVKSEDTVYCCEGFYRAFDPGLSPRSVSYWMRAEQTGPELGYVRLNSTSNASAALLTSYFTGSALALSGPGGLTVVPFVAGEWYHVELRDIDWQARTFRYFVNGVQYGTTHALPADMGADAIRRIDLYSSRSTPMEPPRVRFDQIVFR